MKDELLFKWCCDAITLAKEAGEIILSFYDKSNDELSITEKSDRTLLTKADLAANHYIVQGLKKIKPNFPVISEESDIPDFSERVHFEKYWLVDPLDGTRGFVERRAEFTVNIALIEHHRSIMGVLYVPCEKTCYYALRDEGAFKQVADEPASPIKTLEFKADSVNVLLGHYLHSPDLPNQFKQHCADWNINSVNSSWKFALIAEGQADLYPRLGPTSEWDTAAGQIILEEAGGLVVDLNGEPLRYNTKESLINPSFVAMGDRKYLTNILRLCKVPRTK